MALRDIVLVPDPILRQQAAPVDSFDEELRTLVRDMIETMHAAPGIGLAGPQVNVSSRVAVVDVTAGEDPDAVLVLVNPVIDETSGSESDEEGCLSIPGLTDKVERATSIRLRAQDVDGREFELEAQDLTARAIQHEIDHLDGILFIDRLRGLRRERARRRLKRLLQEAAVAS